MKPRHTIPLVVRHLLIALLIATRSDGSPLLAAPAAPAPPPSLSGVWGETTQIVFCTRLPYDDAHWYANIGYYCDDAQRKAYAGNGRPDVGQLLRLDLTTRSVTVLFDAAGGSVRDPQVHYDGGKILFSHRPAGTDYYHLYEINADGSGRRQLTSGPFDDYEPTYLPDGGIAFVSTRCVRWVNCWMTQVGVLYRCDADGGNLELLSANTEHDNTPWVLPDGRLLYTRWEYVDRSQVEFHHLWTMNPDGTGQMVYYGNLRPHVVMIDAKPVPGTDQVVASFSPGHGVNEHNGIITLVGSERGPDDPAAVRPLHSGRLMRDPFALSTNSILAARDQQIVLLDGRGGVAVLYQHPGPGQVHEPRPVLPRPRERVIPARIDRRQPHGTMILADLYASRNLPGVRRGEVKKLLVLESLPKPVNFSGGPDLTSWLGTFTLERVLGTVPVEPDGSACFELPADRQCFFVALDEHDLSVKRMQSFASVRPGETTGCVGCHEHRAQTPPASVAANVMALRRPPSRLEPFEGHPDVLDFMRDVQPLLDRHCVGCHGYERREGGVLLGGDLGPHWSHSYFSLLAWRQVADGRNGLGNQPPRSLGSAASPLLRKAEGGHQEVKLTATEWRTLWLWIESGAPFAGTYAALRNAEQQARATAALHEVGKQLEIIQRRCATCHTSDQPAPGQPLRLPCEANVEERRKQAARPVAVYERIVFPNDPIARYSFNVLLNFSRPSHSPLLLAPLARTAGGWEACGAVFADTQDADYLGLLRAIARGQAALEPEPRFGQERFRPNPQYVRELQRCGVLTAGFDPLADNLDVFAVDQQYWRLFWHVP